MWSATGVTLFLLCISTLGQTASGDETTERFGAFRLYQDRARSYCFPNERASERPLTCIAVSYLEDAPLWHFEPTASSTPSTARRNPFAALVSLSTNDGTRTSICRPSEDTGRVVCSHDADDVDTTPWARLVRITLGLEGHVGNLTNGDLVVIRSELGQPVECGLVDNVLVCDGTATATTFRVVI